MDRGAQEGRRWDEPGPSVPWDPGEANMPVARATPTWRTHLAEYWLLAAVALALLVSGGLFLGLLRPPF